jgi:hypothetical protein
LFFFAYKLISPDVWTGTSDNGKWEARLFKTKEGSKWVYDGNFYWIGSKEDLKDVKVTLTQYLINDTFKAGEKKDTDGLDLDNDHIAFVGMTNKPKKTDKVQAIIHWQKDGKTYSDTVTLSKSYLH